MQLLQYTLILIICYIGTISGLILSKIAPEEINPGKKYFRITSILLLIVILALLTYHSGFSIFSIIFLLIAVYLITKKNISSIYPLLAIILFLSLNNQFFLTIQASLIFLFGIFITLDSISRNKSIILRQSLFIVVGIIFYLLNNYNPIA